MAGILTSLHNTVIAGFVLAALLLALFLGTGGALDYAFYTYLLRWLHVLSGVMWIGILWYFNFFAKSFDIKQFYFPLTDSEGLILPSKINLSLKLIYIIQLVESVY